MAEPINQQPEPASPPAEAMITGIDNVVRAQLDTHLEKLEKRFEAEGLAFVGPIRHGVEDYFRQGIEAVSQRKDKRDKVFIVLDTPGGTVEVVERMVDIVRHHFKVVNFVIPDRAMSAGTVFAMSGDSIWMDYASVLGPIDPQIEKDGKLIPALAYLVSYDQLVEKAGQGQLTTAEMLLLQKLDLGELQWFRDAKALSVDLLKKWLVTYKFKDWTVTDGKKQPVTPAMKEQRAEAIANALVETTRWHSHGRGIPMKVLGGDDLKLRIDDFGADVSLGRLVREYFHVLRDFAHTRRLPNLIHTRGFW